MIVIDTSAIMALLLKEPTLKSILDVLQAEKDVFISAGTLSEVLILGNVRGVNIELHEFLDAYPLHVVAVVEETAQAIGQAYRRYGKGFHAAALNYGDCFAYVLAKELGCPLLFVGNDFSRTDIVSALGQG